MECGLPWRLIDDAVAASVSLALQASRFAVERLLGLRIVGPLVRCQGLVREKHRILLEYALSFSPFAMREWV